MYAYVYACMHARMYTYIRTYVHTYVCMCVCVRMHACTGMYVCMYACMNACMYMHVRIQMLFKNITNYGIADRYYFDNWYTERQTVILNFPSNFWLYSMHICMYIIYVCI